MTTMQWALLIPSIIVFLTAAAAFLQAKAAQKAVVQVSEQVHDVHMAINGRLTQLLASTSDAAHAAGEAGLPAAVLPDPSPANTVHRGP